MHKPLCLLFIVLTAYLNLAGQLPHFSFQHYSSENGYPIKECSSIAQDKNGYIWVKQVSSLLRFDGTNFHVYAYSDYDSFSLPKGRAYDIANGDNERLIVSYNKGICYYDPSVDGFRKLIPDDSIRSGIAASPFATKDKLWFALQDKTIRHVDFKKGNITTYAKCPSNITFVYADSRSRIWIGTHAGLYQFFPGENRYELYWKDTVHTEYGAGMVTGINEDREHSIWFTGFNSGVYRMNPENRAIRFYDFKPMHWTTLQYFAINNLLIHTINGKQYIFTDSNDGAVILDPETGIYSLLIYDPANRQSVPQNEITDLFFDKTGTLWVTGKNGISKSDRIQPLFKTVHLACLAKNQYTGKPNLTNESNKEITSIVPDGDQVWIATTTQGVLQYNLKKENLVKQILLPATGIRTLPVSELYMDREARLWIGTTEGVYVYIPSSGKLVNLGKENIGKDTFAKTEITDNIIEDSQGNIWVGTTEGISIYNNQLRFLKNLKEEKNNPGSLKGAHIFAMCPAPDQQIWIATKTLNLYDEKKASFIPVSTRFKSTPSFVYEIRQDQEGGIYFTSVHVIYHLKKGSDSFLLPPFTKYTDQDFRATLTDHSGNLWIATSNSGLLKVHLADNSITGFNSRKGLLSNSVMDEWQSSDGTIFLPTIDGFQYFQPDSIKRDTTRAPLRITGISILENHVKADYNKFSDSVLRISYKQNMITFDFGLMDYSFSENISYQYKLEGFNDKWINAGKRPTATYTNLDAGNYIFRVRAKNHDGIEMNEEAIVRLKIIPPFWKTWWFLSALIIVMLGLLFIWIRSLQQKIRSQKILNRFATSLYGQNTIEEIFWDIARDCVKLLGFVDCVVYVKDEKRNVLLQKAAYGPKNTGPYEIMNPIEIPIGKGIVGRVANTGKAERIGNTLKDPRYIMDDVRRLSELTVPVMVDGNVFGVIDSEHPQKNFYSRWHLRMLKEIAAICSAKISLQVVQDRIRSKIARDLHDDMGSTLSSINIISKMALENATGAEQVSSHLKKIQENSGNMLESMSDIVWAITPSNDTLEKVIYRMKEFAADILEPLNIRYDFVENGDFGNIKLDLNKRKDFYLLFKEAINNAAKYSHCNQISIGLSGSESMIEMIIHDNGDGFDVMKARIGNGLANMNDRARQLQGHLEIESNPGRGTTVSLKIKSHD